MDIGSLAQWVSAAVTLTAVLVALFGEWARGKLFRPRLVLALKRPQGEPAKVHRVQPYYEGMTIEELKIAQEGGEILDARYFHIEVTNRTSWPHAHDVRLYLIRVDEPDASGDYKTVLTDELPMSAKDEAVYQISRTVGRPLTFDVFSIDQKKNFRVHTAIEKFSFTSFLKPPINRRYFFIARADEGESGVLCLQVNWTGDWHDTWEKLDGPFKLKVVHTDAQ